MIDHERVHQRLRLARQSRTGAIEDIAASKKQLSDAESEIEECLKEIETDEPVRPLLDQIERTAPPARDPAEQPTDGGTDFHGRRTRRKTERADARVAPLPMAPAEPVAFVGMPPGGWIREAWHNACEQLGVASELRLVCCLECRAACVIHQHRICPSCGGQLARGEWPPPTDPTPKPGRRKTAVPLSRKGETVG